MRHLEWGSISCVHYAFVVAPHPIISATPHGHTNVIHPSCIRATHMRALTLPCIPWHISHSAQFASLYLHPNCYMTHLNTLPHIHHTCAIPWYSALCIISAISCFTIYAPSTITQHTCAFNLVPWYVQRIMYTMITYSHFHHACATWSGAPYHVCTTPWL